MDSRSSEHIPPPTASAGQCPGNGKFIFAPGAPTEVIWSIFPMVGPNVSSHRDLLRQEKPLTALLPERTKDSTSVVSTKAAARPTFGWKTAASFISIESRN